MTITPNRYYIPEGYIPKKAVPKFGCADPFPCNVCGTSDLVVYGYEHQTKRDIWVCEGCQKTHTSNKHQIPDGYFSALSMGIFQDDDPGECDVCGDSVSILFSYEHKGDNPDILVCDTCRVKSVTKEQEVLDG